MTKHMSEPMPFAENYITISWDPLTTRFSLRWTSNDMPQRNASLPWRRHLFSPQLQSKVHSSRSRHTESTNQRRIQRSERLRGNSRLPQFRADRLPNQVRMVR
jgi:hypothetical protein